MVYRKVLETPLNFKLSNMWYRISRLCKAGSNAYVFYSNPFRYFVTFLLALLIPYAVYLFWGSLFVLILAAFGIYFLFKLVKSALKKAPLS